MTELETVQAQQIQYPYAIYWYHVSTYSYSSNKAKVKFFETIEKATKEYNKLSKLASEERTYRQGYITYLTTNF